MERLLVANRGEIACRIIRAAETLGIPTVAVYSEADKDLPHVMLADEAIHIGPASARESYLDAGRLLEVAKSTNCTLVHPGYGFLSENAGFAKRCAEAGLTFVGPAAEHIDLMGDKQNARDAAIAAGVPVLPGTGRLTEDTDAIVALGDEVGFPLLVKAVAGGGGHGMQRVESRDKLLGIVERTRNFAGRVFGDDGVYLERCLTHARHVEVQIFGFGEFGAVHLFERDCSLQRRHQKVIEEAPAPGLSGAARARMTGAAVSLAKSIGYMGAGTVEYLYDPKTEEFYFLEMNTRIQVEHPVTEAITGLDLVAAQLRLAMAPNDPPFLVQEEISCSGASFEARVYAENPAKKFMPSPGLIETMTLPDLPGIRYDWGYQSGNEVSVHYDPMIMKVIAHGADREQARQRLIAALKGMEIGGLITNCSFLADLLQREEVAKASFDTGSIEQMLLSA